MDPRTIWLTAALFVLVPATGGHASTTPRELYGKSLVVSWTEVRNQTYPDGSKTRPTVRTAFTIYFSDTGRRFVKSARLTLNSRGNELYATAHSKAPGGDIIKTSNSRYFPTGRFIGRSFVSTVQYESGARQVTATFDEGFRNCALAFSHGKESGAPGLVMRGSNGKLLMLTSIEVSAPSCAVRDGNAFTDE